MKVFWLIGLALKNLTRYKRRSLITASVIAVGMASYILLDSLVIGARIESERNIIFYEMTRSEVMDSRFWKDHDYRPLEYSVEDADRIISDLENKGIKAVGRTEFSAELIVSEDPWPREGAMQMIVTAIDPVADAKLFKLGETVSRGRFIEQGEDAVVIGSWLAKDLGLGELEEGPWIITLNTRTRDGFYQTMDLEVVGILETENPIVNRHGLYMPLDTADEYLTMEGSVTMIAVDTPKGLRGRRVEKITGEILSSYDKNLAIIPWKELARDFLSATNGDAVSSLIMLSIVFIIAIVGISNTMIMTVMERQKELGMMRSLGMRDKNIRDLFLWEAGGIGLLGALTGILLLAVPLNTLLVVFGINYTEMMKQGDYGYRFLGIMRGVWNAKAYFIAVGFSLATTAGAAWISTRSLLKRDITTCLRDGGGK